MYSSEETYRSLVNHELDWPNHKYDGRVLFVMQPLEGSRFIWNSESDGFWRAWVGPKLLYELPSSERMTID